MGGHHYQRIKLFSSGDIHHAKNIPTRDLSRPTWGFGDRVKLTFDTSSGAQTLSYWHKGKLKTTFESKMKFEHSKWAEGDQIAFYCYASTSGVSFSIVAEGDDSKDAPQ